MKNGIFKFMTVAFALSVAAPAFAAGNLAEAKKEYAERLQELRACEDGVFEMKRAEMLAFIKDPGITNADQRVEFLLVTVAKDGQGVFEKPDCWELAEKVVAADPAGRRRLVSMKASAFASYSKGREMGLRRWSPEARLEFAEGLLKEKDFYFTGCCEKLAALKALGRYDDCIAFANAEVAKAGQNGEKIALLLMLAEFHKSSARRYYDAPEPSELKKAIAAVERLLAIESTSRDRNIRKASLLAAEASFLLGDYASSLAYLEKVKAFDKGKFSVDSYDLQARIAYAGESYGEAADLWLECSKNKGRIDREKLVRALFAADRKEEAVPFLEEMSKKGNKYKRDFYGYVLKEMNESK